MPIKLVKNLQPGDFVQSKVGYTKVISAQQMDLMEAKNGKVWMIETEDGGITLANSLDGIDVRVTVSPFVANTATTPTKSQQH